MVQIPTDSRETERLLQQARAGDREAADQLLANHRSHLCQLVELHLDPKLRARVDPSDVVQEAQMEAVRRLDTYLARPTIPFRLWLRQLAIDRLIMLRRRHVTAACRAVSQEVVLTEQSSLMLAGQLLASDSSPSQQIDRHDLACRVRRAMTELPSADQQVLLMRNFEGLSFDEVGCLLGVDATTARKRHGRALLKLHRILSEGGLTESQL